MDKIMLLIDEGPIKRPTSGPAAQIFAPWRKGRITPLDMYLANGDFSEAEIAAYKALAIGETLGKATRIL